MVLLDIEFEIIWKKKIYLKFSFSSQSFFFKSTHTCKRARVNSGLLEHLKRSPSLDLLTGFNGLLLLFFFSEFIEFYIDEFIDSGLISCVMLKMGQEDKT